MVREIKRDELQSMMDSGKSFVLVNVLDPEDFDRSHICGSINIPVSAIEEDAGDLLDKDETVVVYCAGPQCKASEEAADKLSTMGYKDVRRFEGGMQHWMEAGLCVEGEAVKGAA